MLYPPSCILHTRQTPMEWHIFYPSAFFLQKEARLFPCFQKKTPAHGTPSFSIQYGKKYVLQPEGAQYKEVPSPCFSHKKPLPPVPYIPVCSEAHTDLQEALYPVFFKIAVAAPS